jgi:dTDP-glucose 4,6-dehydratase
VTRVVVLGAAGFLGSHLCDALISRGDSVIGVDDFSSGRKENIKHLEGSLAFSFHEQNIVQELHISGHIDAVLNFASPASPDRYREMPLHTLRTGSAGTDHALQLASREGARLIMASTSEVYGEPLVHPQPESYWGNVNPIGERSCYDEAKRYSEALCMAYKREQSTDIGIARIFNTYGPRLSAGDGRVVSNFITQAIEGKPLSIYGNGLQTRSFCFVDDLVRGILALLDSTEVGPINIGSTDECSMLQLAETILELTGSASILDFQPKVVDDPTQRRPNIDLAKNKLGWEPTVSLRDGLKKTIHFFKSA